MQRLEQLHTADGRTLPPRLEAEILRELQRLELVIGMIKTIEVGHDAIASIPNGHLLLELGVATFRIVTHLVRLDFLVAENLAHRALD